MVAARVRISAGEDRTFSIAGVPVAFESEPSCNFRFALPVSYEPFLTPGPTDVRIRVAARSRLDPACGRLLCESGLQWRALQADGSTVFEFKHPPTARLYCQAIVHRDFSRAEILFSETAWRELAPSPGDCWEIPHPLEQLLLVPALALRGAVLLHACGAIVSNRGLVFAGHSGDGKTTLAGLLSAEGIALLSDERIAIRRTNQGFVAYGTPWPGEGNVVSSASSPVVGIFVLRKSLHHAMGDRSPSLTPDLLARAIVPYYLPEIAARILEIFSELATSVPFRELRFARSPGIASLLREAA
jgi:hypothetical protein